MKLYYDFHIHTALSPCADNDMTPNNIVNMAMIKGLNVIGITDHNSCKNVEACIKIGKDIGVLVIPGMELETSEEIHVVCLMPELAKALEFDREVEKHLLPVKNNPDIFGEQYIMNEDDEITGEYDNLLIAATSLDFSQAFKLVRSYGGVLIPAHVDRGSNSVISNIGFMPEELDISYVELSRNAGDFMDNNKNRFFREYKTLHSSDAHYLGDISEPVNYINLDKESETLVPADIINILL